MTIAVTVANGLGTAGSRLVAFDGAAAFALAGLAAATYGVAVTGRLTTPDGKTALATDATGTVSGTGTVTLTFNTDTAATLEHMGPGRRLTYSALLTVYATATGAVCCRATIPMVMGAKAGTTV